MAIKPVLSLLLAAAVAAGVSWGLRNEPSVGASRKDLYDTIRERGTIRCGYFDEAPFTVLDMSKNTRSGFSVELMEEIAAQNGLTVEWVTPINFSTWLEDLQNGRYDVLCGSTFAIPHGEGKVDYTTPYAFATLGAYTRPDVTRFDNNLIALNSKGVTFSATDGDGYTLIKRKLFPLAQEYNLPSDIDISQLLLGVAGRKADVALVLKSVFRNFNAANPGVLREVVSDTPVYTYPITFGLRPHENTLRQFLDTNIRTMLATGELQRMYDKYVTPDMGIVLPGRPY